MVDAFYDEGNEDWTAPSQASPSGMRMQAQNTNAFDDQDFPTGPSSVTIQTASGASMNLDDDLTDEEKMIVHQAALYQEDLKRKVHDRMMALASEKQERKNAGYSAIQKWQSERQGQIQLRQQNNQEHERQFHLKRENERHGNNPWDRVTENCDLSLSGVIAGGKDKTRMKQAMLNRKADATNGGKVIGNFGTNIDGL